MEEGSTPTVVFETAIYALVMILSLLGNFVVCYAVRRNPRLVRCSSNCYIMSLALTDISQALFVMPLSVALLATGEWPFGAPLCYFAAISKMTLAKTSTYTMALMALNRYYKIVKPAKYQTIFTKKFIITTASVVWVTPLLSTLLVLFSYDFDVKPTLGFAVCVIDFNPFALPVLLVMLYSPYFVIVFCYWKIYRAVKRHNANVSWQSANVADVKVSKTLFVTVVGFAILYVPAHAIFIVSILVSLPRQLTMLANLLVFTSSCVNPFIYGFMNRAFKVEFKKILTQRSIRSISTESSKAQ